MEKVLLFADPGIDDSVAIIYALLHPSIDVIGIVAGYGNVERDQAVQNAAYLISLAGRSEIPLFAGSEYPLTGEVAPYYPEIHGEEGLGPIVPPEGIPAELLPFTELFPLIEKHKEELTIIDIGRSTSLALAFVLQNELMSAVKRFIIMGGAFLVPGNVTPLAEANFFIDPVATQVILTRARPLTIISLNVTSYALVTDDMIEEVTETNYNPFTFLMRPVFDYYASAYQELAPGIKGAPFHDVAAVMASQYNGIFDFIKKDVSISLEGETRGLSIADFRPGAEAGDISIAVTMDYPSFRNSFVDVLKRRL
ncbi:nucleoside hydrolase [Thalassorhabdus alkalitolerans]|uniref:Nucleoside hydrolase n=1 Tax=Thalassorhabdus alkalitolerans TaxID=2282697 RepID=A0ABW0YKY8_9BACI